MAHRITRRTFLGAGAASAAVGALPVTLRAQAKTIKIGVISPVTGALAEVGQDCRLGAQMAAEAVNAGAVYAYEVVVVMADVLERAGSTDPDALVTAIRKTSFAGGVTTATGPVTFNELGDNPNASTAAIQILGGKPRVVWPKDAAEQAFVFPRPKL